MRRALLLAALAALPLAALAQNIDMSQGGPVDVTATDGIEWRQAEQVVIARGNARAIRAGVTVEAYLSHYDPTAALPFPGVEELISQLDRWGLASNKERRSGYRELERLG